MIASFAAQVFAAHAVGQCGPEAGHDCCTTGGPGCSDSECCALVCQFNPFCCDTAWDEFCVDDADGSCGETIGAYCSYEIRCPNPNHDCCTTANPGCADEACCKIVCALNPSCCESWWDSDCVALADAHCGNADQTYCPSICPNPSHSCCECGTPGCADENCCEIVCALDPFCCETRWDNLCMASANTHCYAGGCAPNCPCVDPCPNSQHDCCTTGCPGCADLECCVEVCPIDPFCCEVAWDEICVNEAAAMCDGAKCPNACAADVNSDDQVNIDDLFSVIGSWGPCDHPCPPSCEHGIDHDCDVDIDDLFMVIAAWGPCP